MNFSLHSTTGQSLATLPPGGQDLPRLQRPVRRRLSPGKVMAGGVVALLGVGRVRRLQRPRHEQADQGPCSPAPTTDVITHGRPHRATLQITVVEKGGLESSEEQRCLLQLVEGGRRSS